MFSKVLIANRGEIAVRVMRACRELGISTAAVYSEADRDCMHAQLADEAVCVGPGSPAESYLNVPNIISAALKVGADAIHPGAGFLSENAFFAEICHQYGIAYVGPSPEVIAAVADKSRAIELAREAGLPTLETSNRDLIDVQTAKSELQRIGCPAMLKAKAGGGGRGLRRVRTLSELPELFVRAQAEARGSFSIDDLYLERLITGARHIEVQVLADESAQLHLWERDCSVQRRHQKVIEESPAPGLSNESRGQLAQAAIDLTRHLGYTNAGTVEFLVGADGGFYFIELNSRLQVEHPVTEAITGVDLVKKQLAIAAGEGVGMTQAEISSTGHAIECRVLAEDAARDWTPASGVISKFAAPGGPGVRVDTHVYSGYDVPSNYDSLLAKITCWGRDRAEAVARTRRAVAECEVEGVTNNLAYLGEALSDPAFVRGEYHLDKPLGAFEPDAALVAV